MGIYNKIIIKFYRTIKNTSKNLKNMFLLLINAQDKNNCHIGMRIH